jgi:hypothetical protein
VELKTNFFSYGAYHFGRANKNDRGDDLALFKQYKEMTEKIAYHFLILFEKCQVIPPYHFLMGRLPHWGKTLSALVRTHNKVRVFCPPGASTREE